MIKIYKVYIVKCKDDSLYTWIALDLEKRLKQHNWVISWWAKYTLSRKPVKLVYYKEIGDRSTATKEELRIKKLNKLQKLILIKNGKEINKI